MAFRPGWWAATAPNTDSEVGPSEVAAVRLHIGWTRCDGRGLCTELLPDVLDRDDWGYPLARDGSREPEVPARDHKYAKAAVKRCPRLARSLAD